MNCISPSVSVVVPVYNESDGLRVFHEEILMQTLLKLDSSIEIIYVNDGSKDNTLDVLNEIAKGNKFIKVINFSRNFGKEMAVTAGIGIASGEVIIIMDGDGQHPPELIPEFIKKWKNGAQIVVGIRRGNQKEGFVKRYGSIAFYKIFNSISGAKIIPGSTDFRLIDKSVRCAFLSCTERHRITRGLIDWLGFKRDYIDFEAPARIAGEASYKTGQLVRLAMNSFISLSLKPLFFFGWVGVLITIFSLGLGIFIIVEQLLLGDPLMLNFTGSAMLGIFISFMVGLVLMSQAMLAIYLSHIHVQTQGRPLFIVDESSSINIK